ncbi:hypothetical protein EUGRSUZ_E00786 [Eucalyptus grandis]|uniref:Uncharacterized protein n=2 Tax=Eucalyptus grandis TaxID=71139 RepID=A0ACC3KSQ1_EUCGR|nr:hypothetical protein EUGRSUZ_E00786 [Eucalyptus grandis]
MTSVLVKGKRDVVSLEVWRFPSFPMFAITETLEFNERLFRIGIVGWDEAEKTKEGSGREKARQTPQRR